MRVIFIGSSSFGLKCLDAVGQLSSLSVVGVITNPKAFSISYSSEPVTNVLHADFSSWALDHQLPCFEMLTNMHDESMYDWINTLEPDLFLVVGWYHMIPSALRKIAPAYGLHASLLPDYSGGAPLVWAMINGESKTGITLFQMNSGVDAGLIAGQKEETIFSTDTIATLYSRIEEKGIQLLIELLPQVADGSLQLWEQDENKRRIFRQRDPTDGWIDWSQSIEAIDRFIRAQTRPYPGAYTHFLGQRLTVWSASVIRERGDLVIPKIVKSTVGFCVPCLGGMLLLEEVSYRGIDYKGSQLSNLFKEGGQLLGGIGVS